MEHHRLVVAQIASTVRTFYERKQPYHIYHGSTNCTRASTKTSSNTVDTSALQRVLAIDRARKTVLVESNVPMDQLVEATLAHGLVPPVVMEFPGITAGGGFSGTSGESSSFRHGFFDRTINRVELVLANGDIVEVSPSTNPELFYGAAASFGSLGITTMLEIQLVEAKPFVRLEYFPIRGGVTAALDKINAITANADYDYLDGIMYSKTDVVICAGKLVDEPNPSAIQQFTRPTDPWFYMHVETLLRSPSVTTEYIPLVDYLFRYNRGGFWVGKYAFEYFKIPQTRFFRWLLDGVSHTRVMYHAVHKSGLFKQYTIQDIAVPYDNASSLIDYLDESFQQYPLWLCPLRQTTRAPDSSQIHGLLAERHNPTRHLSDPEMMLSLGVWAPGPGSREECIQFNKALERKLQTLGGHKWLYGRTYYSEAEFWSIYQRGPMDQLREKYHASHLPSLYQKVKIGKTPETTLATRVLETWPINGLYGLLHTFVRTEYLLSSSSRVHRPRVFGVLLFLVCIFLFLGVVV